MAWLLRALVWPFRGAIMLVVATLLLFEEWGWEPLSRQIARLARLPFFAKLEAAIGKLSRWPALLVLAVPVVLLFPIKLAALALLASGKKAMGLALLLAAKLVGTALVARLFKLTENALMQFTWFAKWYPRWKAWKDALLARVRSSKFWRMAAHMRAVAAKRIQAVWAGR